jgi:hypothetical protein
MSSATQIGQELASVPFDEMIRNILLAMVDAQNQANSSFIEGIQELADADVEIKYKKGSEEKTVTGNAIALGILPTMLQIQQGVIELKMAITMEKKREAQVGIKAKAGWAFFSASVDAKYSSSYSYKVEASSFVRIQVAPAPPPQPLMTVIQKIMEDNPVSLPA